MNLQGRSAIVTGASSGFGRATAVAMSKLGAQVVLADLDDVWGATALAEVQVGRGQGAFVQVDVGTAEGAAKAVQCAVSEFGGVDILVNNAGIRQGQLVDSWNADEDSWDRILRTNLKSVYLCSRAAVPSMTERGGGSIVNVASIAAHIAVAGVAYAASKGGIVSYTKHAAYELADKAIRVNCVSPGFMRTPMSTGEREGASPQQQEHWVKGWARRIPLGHVGTAADVAEAICFLASDAASYITGQELIVDGGMLIRGPRE